jgi:hypothetical protein
MVADDWTDAQKRAYRIADNQLALNAGWDEQLLGIELGELRGLGVDLALIGFDAAEIDRLLADPQAPDGFKAYDETIPTEHVCPRCGYRFSGGDTVTEAADGDADAERDAPE